MIGGLVQTIEQPHFQMIFVLRKSCSPKQTKPRVLARFKEAKLNVKAKFIYIFINCKMFNSEKRKSYPYCGC